MKNAFCQLVFGSISLFVVLSCTKTNTNTVTDIVTDTITKTVTDTIKPSPTIVGFWVGTYQVTGTPTAYYYSFDLRPDTTLIYKAVGSDGNTYYGAGTYSLTGTAFTFTFTVLNLSLAGAVQTGTGTYTASTATITGNWQNQGTTGGGTFS